MISSLTLQGLPAFLRTEMGDGAMRRVITATGVDVEALEGVHGFIPHAAVSAFVTASAHAIGDAQFGLHIAPQMTLESYGVWASYVLQAETLGDAIARCIDVLPYHSAGDRMSLAIDGEEAHYGYHFALAGRPGHEHVAPAAAGVLSSLCRLYGPRGARPLRIELDMPRPRHVSPFEQVFGCDILFDAPAITIVLRRQRLNDRRRAGRGRLVTLEDLARDRNGRAPRDILDVMAEQIRLQVRGGTVSLDRMAAAMHTSTRTLQREFNRAGTDFRGMARAARMARACELLRAENATVTDVALELGYATHANFTRAFRAATDTTPRAYRRNAGSMSRRASVSVPHP